MCFTGTVICVFTVCFTFLIATLELKNTIILEKPQYITVTGSRFKHVLTHRTCKWLTRSHGVKLNEVEQLACHSSGVSWTVAAHYESLQIYIIILMYSTLLLSLLAFITNQTLCTSHLLSNNTDSCDDYSTDSFPCTVA